MTNEIQMYGGPASTGGGQDLIRGGGAGVDCGDDLAACADTMRRITNVQQRIGQRNLMDGEQDHGQ